MNNRRDKIESVKERVVRVVNVLPMGVSINSTRVVMEVNAQCMADGYAVPSKNLILRCIGRLIKCGYLTRDTVNTIDVGFYYFTKVTNVLTDVPLNELFGKIHS